MFFAQYLNRKMYKIFNLEQLKVQNADESNELVKPISRSESKCSTTSVNNSCSQVLQQQTDVENKDTKINENNYTESSLNSQQKSSNESENEKNIFPHKDVLKEADFQVKIADLGNACWTVYILVNIYNYILKTGIVNEQIALYIKTLVYFFIVIF